MLTSWHNFFFVSAEPGGSVTIDKPPLGLWFQVISAYFLGVNGFALALPQAIAGTLCVPLLYRMVSKYFNRAAGLIAALVIAFTPVAVSVDRNNTMDSTLIFTLLLATWMFLKAIETDKLRFLWLGAMLIGVGFNIKMLQAFLPLPALYVTYFDNTHHKWWKKIKHLTGATAILLVVSFAWPIAVDLTPASERPYIGSSAGNSAMELVVGYNGLDRLIYPTSFQGQQDVVYLGSSETGNASITRLFTPPLAPEVSWLIPFALLGLLFAFSLLKQNELSSMQWASLTLWGAWLAIGMTFFTVAHFFHAYYMAMLALPLAALVGISLWSIWRTLDKAYWKGVLALMVPSSITLVFHLYLLANYPDQKAWLIPAMLVLMTLGAVGVLIQKAQQKWIVMTGIGLVMAAVFLAPFTWAVLTTLNPSPYRMLPRSGPLIPEVDLDLEFEAILAYIEPRTQDMAYMLAVQSSFTGAPFILETGRPVLYMGGFAGKDPVVSVDDLVQMVANGELAYLLISDDERVNPGVFQWVENHCITAPGFTSDNADEGQGGADWQGNSMTLYECQDV